MLYIKYFLTKVLYLGIDKREPLDTPVGLSEVPRQKSLIPCNIKNYEKAIFAMG
jgi:hypothetical protein